MLAATGESVGSAAPDVDEGGTLDSQFSSSIRDLVTYGCSRPDFNDGGPLSAKVWAGSVSLKFNKILSARIEHLHQMLAPEDCKRARARIKSCSGIGAQWVAAIPTGPKTMLNDDGAYACVLDSDLKPHARLF